MVAKQKVNFITEHHFSYTRVSQTEVREPLEVCDRTAGGLLVNERLIIKVGMKRKLREFFFFSIVNRLSQDEALV